VARSAPPKPDAKSRSTKPPTVAPPSAGSSPRERFPETLHWRWPADGQVLTKYQSANETRKGIKIGGKKGYAVTAAEAGKVVYSGSGLIGYGRLIIIKHNNEYLSAYGHNRKLLVKEGDWVAKGDKIAEMGLANNGQAMLHFEIRRNGKPVNPVALLPRRSG
jgi:lipoprotein NlpD